MYTRHPYPTDDIMEEVGEDIKSMVMDSGYKDPIIIDCHNSLKGDEIMIEHGSEEAHCLFVTQFSGFQHQWKCLLEFTSIIEGQAFVECRIRPQLVAQRDIQREKVADQLEHWSAARP